MKNLTLGVVAALALIVPATAQQMGSSNRNAPTVSSSITFAESEATIALSYTALNFADGKFMEGLKNERFREMMNSNAKENPVGSLTLPADMNIGGKDCEAGDYGVHFLASDAGNFILTLSKDGELTQWELTGLEKSSKKRSRLVMNLVAAPKTTEAELHLHFGNLAMDIPVKPVAKSDKQN